MLLALHGASWAPFPPAGESNDRSSTSFKCPDFTDTSMAPRRGLAAALCAGKVYVIGGWDGTAYLSTVEVYDVVKGTWTTAKSMPKPRCFAAAVSLGGKVYVAGGYYGSYNLETVEVYDPNTDEWSALPSMSCARRGLALATLGSRSDIHPNLQISLHFRSQRGLAQQTARESMWPGTANCS